MSRGGAQRESPPEIPERSDVFGAERFKRGDLALADDAAEGGVGSDRLGDGGGRVWVGVVGEGELPDPVERVGDEDGDGDFEDGSAVAVADEVLGDGWGEDERLRWLDLAGGVVGYSEPGDGPQLRFDGGENLADGGGGQGCSSALC